MKLPEHERGTVEIAQPRKDHTAQNDAILTILGFVGLVMSGVAIFPPLYFGLPRAVVLNSTSVSGQLNASAPGSTIGFDSFAIDRNDDLKTSLEMMAGMGITFVTLLQICVYFLFIVVAFPPAMYLACFVFVASHKRDGMRAVELESSILLLLGLISVPVGSVLPAMILYQTSGSSWTWATLWLILWLEPLCCLLILDWGQHAFSGTTRTYLVFLESIYLVL